MLNRNTIDSDPAMFSPSIYKWIYKIDGNHELLVDGAMIDMRSLKDDNKVWSVKLNTFMGDQTYYKLDLGELKNNEYPFSKYFYELTSVDSRLYPYSIDNYYNWLQHNQTTLETSKNAFQIEKKYDKQEMDIANTFGLLSGFFGGATSGATSDMFKGGGGVGAFFGGAIGAVGGLATAGFGKIGAEMGYDLAWRRNQESFDNQWRGSLGNIYRSPSYVSRNGFASGSLNYAIWNQQENNDFSTFFPYELPIIVRKSLWQDIAWNGYKFLSTCAFKEYDNRENFNFIQMDTYTKSIVIDTAIKKELSKKTLLFSQQQWIDWFKNKLSTGVRLFQVDWDGTLDEESAIVVTNIEKGTKPWKQVNTQGNGLLMEKLKVDSPKAYSFIQKSIQDKTKSEK